MAKHQQAPPDARGTTPYDAVARNLGGAYWSVDDCRWQSIRPGLPDDLVDLLAPPIVVGVVPVAAAVTAPRTPAAVNRVGPVPAGPAPRGGKVPTVAAVKPAGAKAGGTTRPPSPGRHRRSGPTG